MNDKQAHNALKKINAQRNVIGTGGYRDSRKAKVERHETLNTAITELNKVSDQQKLKEIEND